MSPIALCRSRFSALLLAVAAAPLAAPPAGAVEGPKWKFEVGQKHHYRLTQTMDMEMNMAAGAAVDTSTTSTIDMTMETKEVKDDGSAVMTQRITRMQMTMAIPGNAPMTYDTDSTEEPQGFATMVAPLFKEMTRGEFQITMTPRGKITDMVVPKEMIDALAKAPGAQALGELTTEEGFKKMVGGVSFEVPETLDEGTEWSTTAEMANPVLGKQVITSTYRYLGPDEENPNLEVFAPNIKISFEGSDQAQVAISDEMCEGEMKFNREAGRLESSNVTQSMTLQITTGGQQIKQGLTQKVQFEFVPPETN